MKFILKILISTVAVLVSAYLLRPGIEILGLTDYQTPDFRTLTTAILVAVVLAFLNSVVRPILVFLTIPISIFTLGLFLLVINAGMILLAGRLIDGFVVHGFWPALWFSIIMSVITWIFEKIQKKSETRN